MVEFKVTDENKVDNKTGSLRIRTPVISDKCIKCGKCMRYCPENAIKYDEKKNIVYIDYDYCKGCMLCKEVCPVKAILEKKEEKK